MDASTVHVHVLRHVTVYPMGAVIVCVSGMMHPMKCLLGEQYYCIVQGGA